MAKPTTIRITPATLTDLIIVVESTNSIEVKTLADCKVSGSAITLSLAKGSYNLRFYSQGYNVGILENVSGLGNQIELTPTSDYIKTSDGTNNYYVKDNYSRQFGNDLLDIVMTKADSSDVQTAKRNIGEIVQSTIPLTDAGLHLLDGTLLQYGIYKEFIDYIADLYAENPTANYFTDETTWQNSVTQYGSCGKFVYDSTNKTVRLPKVSDILQSTTDINALGDLIRAGLPNIIGALSSLMWKSDDTPSKTGAFTKSTYETGIWNTGSGSLKIKLPVQVNFDASDANPIYGNSNTVQPQTIKAFVYIVIANSSKTDIQVDIDEIATDLNNKAGTDLANVTKTGKVLMSGMGLPSNKALTFTVGASGSNITIPANGWLAFRGKASVANQFVSFKISGNSVYREEERQVPYVNGWATILIPVNAGDTVTYYYNIKASDIFQFQLIYAQGSKN